MRSTIQIGKIMSIPIRLHITFLLVLPIFVLFFASAPELGFRNEPNLTLRYILSTIATILLFTCVLLHELGHSYIAKKHGTKIQAITLFLFGGVSQMEEIPRDPKVELKMAFAGPAVSLIIGAVLLAAYFILPIIPPYATLIRLIGYINIVLFIFNLIPAFPMDGGRLLRAWFAGHMSYINATRRAAEIGKLIAFLMGLFGVITFTVGGWWIILIAFFIYIGASEEERATEITVTLEGIKVKDLMSKNVVSVSPDTAGAELVELMFKEKHMGYPVMEGSRLVGIVTFSDIQQVPKDQWSKVKVRDIMTREVISLGPEDDAVDAFRTLSSHNIGRIIIRENKNVVGILSRTDLIQATQLLGLKEK